MNIIITLTEEPLYLNPFIKKVVEAIPSEIKHIYILKGGVVKGRRFSEKLTYLLTIAIISSPYHLFKRIIITGGFKFFKILEFTQSKNPFSIVRTLKQLGIPYSYVDDLHSEKFLLDLRAKEPTIIINQAQTILEREFLSIPEIGCLNRHCALLPKYRGRLAPFWAYTMGESESGVSIHFIDEEIDNGPILVQKRVPIERNDSFDSVLEKDFALAPGAMIEAINLIRSGEYTEKLIPNEKNHASYFSSPTIKDAIRYREVMLRSWFNGA